MNEERSAVGGHPCPVLVTFEPGHNGPRLKLPDREGFHGWYPGIDRYFLIHPPRSK
jgi:hypothetical protein